VKESAKSFLFTNKTNIKGIKVKLNEIYMKQQVNKNAAKDFVLEKTNLIHKTERNVSKPEKLDRRNKPKPEKLTKRNKPEKLDIA
jgi:hypothetical protein